MVLALAREAALFRIQEMPSDSSSQPTEPSSVIEA